MSIAIAAGQQKLVGDTCVTFLFPVTKYCDDLLGWSNNQFWDLKIFMIWAQDIWKLQFQTFGPLDKRRLDSWIGVKGLHKVLVGMDLHHPVLDGEILVMLSMWRSNVQDQRWPMLCQCAALVSYFGQCLFAYWVGMKWIMFANTRASSMVKRWQKWLVVNPGATGIRIWWSTCLVPSMKRVCRCSPLQALAQEVCKMQSLLDLLLDPSMLRCISVWRHLEQKRLTMVKRSVSTVTIWNGNPIQLTLAASLSMAKLNLLEIKVVLTFAKEEIQHGLRIFHNPLPKTLLKLFVQDLWVLITNSLQVENSPVVCQRINQ